MINKIFDNLMSYKINSKQVLVIAGNHQQFNLFCNEKLMDYENGNYEFEGVEFIYYFNIDGIRGCRFDDYLTFGTWYDRDDIDWQNIRTCMNSNWWNKYYPQYFNK